MAAKTYLITTLKICAVLFLLAQPIFAAQPRYEVIDLGTLSGEDGCAYSINDAGQVVGGSGNNAFFWEDTNGNGQSDPCEMQDLGTLGYDNSIAVAINEFGQVVGYSYSDSLYHPINAFLWEDINQNGHADPGEIQNLGTISGGSRYQALGINNKGQVVGKFEAQVTYPAYPGHCFIWDRTSGMKDVSILTGDKIDSAYSINDAGQVVGSISYIWDNNTNQLTRMELPPAWGAWWCAGKAINNSGQVAGILCFQNGDWRPFLWEDGEMINLGTLGGRMSYAKGMNEIGQVVGNSTLTYANDFLNHAFLWDMINGMVNLNNVLPADSKWKELRYALDINNRGQIVGYGVTEAGELHPFLMTPVPRTIYVDDDAAGANDGSNWKDAFIYLQDALAAAYSGDEIWVAQGIYKPDQGAGITPGDRDATFQLVNGVSIKGGYAGFGEPDPNARDIDLFQTILSGDLNGDDGPDFANNGENSYHVVTGSGTDGTAVLDGFTITAGNANGNDYINRCGGGMLSSHSSPTVTNCTFSGNYTRLDGGGMYWEESNPTISNCLLTGNIGESRGAGIRCYNSNPTITNCIINWNSSGWDGGGMHNTLSSPVIVNCTFSGNSATSGSGMDNNYYSNPIMINCNFIDNSARNWGGAICNFQYSSPSVTNCIFSGNLAHSGGGMYNYDDSQPQLTHCTFNRNLAGWRGGGIFNSNSVPTLTNCILWGDTPMEIYGTIPLVIYSDVEGGWPGEGNIDADPCFIDPGYWDANGTPDDANDNFWVDGDYRLRAGSPCIDAGTDAGVYEDIEGNVRPFDFPAIDNNVELADFDMGAYEAVAIQGELKVLPRTVNRRSRQKYILASVRLPEGITKRQIDTDKPLLLYPSGVEALHQYIFQSRRRGAQQTSILAFFDKAELMEAVPDNGQVELQVVGRLKTGQYFYGIDTVNIIGRSRMPRRSSLNMSRAVSHR